MLLITPPKLRDLSAPQRDTSTDHVGDVWKMRDAPDVTVVEILNDWCLVVTGRPEPKSKLTVVAQEIHDLGYRRVRHA